MVQIWDVKEGDRFISNEEANEIFRNASKILTLYYNTRDLCQIYPFDHAAGDFVIRTEGIKIDIKLTTARDYQPIMIFHEEEETNPMLALVYFFLNLTIRMRLDRIDGVGRGIWVEDYFVQATIQGFFEALNIMVSEGRYHLGEVSDLISLLKAFNIEELYKMYDPLLDFYKWDGPEYISLIQSNLKRHVTCIHKFIQEF